MIYKYRGKDSERDWEMTEAPFSDGMVARQNDTVATGHGCDTVTTILEGESTVLVEGKPVARRSSP